MRDYLKQLGKAAGFDGVICAGGWEDATVERDGRPIPVVAVLWDSDDSVWRGWIGLDHDRHSPAFAHPHEAFAWLKQAVAAYEFPVCQTCDDTGIERWAVGDVEHSDACECWHGQRKLNEADNV